MMADYNPEVLWELAKGRHRDFLRAAAADHLADRAGSGGPGLRARLSLVLADRLIALGLTLRRQYDPQPLPAHLHRHSSP